MTEYKRVVLVGTSDYIDNLLDGWAAPSGAAAVVSVECVDGSALYEPMDTWELVDALDTAIEERDWDDSTVRDQLVSASSSLTVAGMAIKAVDGSLQGTVKTGEAYLYELLDDMRERAIDLLTTWS